MAETLTIIKFGKGMFPQPWPRKVVLAWGSVLGAVALTIGFWSLRFYYLKPRAARQKSKRAASAADTNGKSGQRAKLA